MENSVERNHVNRESMAQSSQFSYTDVMMDMELLEVVTPLSIYQHVTTYVNTPRQHLIRIHQ